MKTNSPRISSFVMVITLLGALLLLFGCAHGLNEVMESYHFTAISPPQSNWENGSVVEIEPRFPNAPVLRSMPSMVPVPITNIEHVAPSVSQSHDEKLDLSLGVSIPGKIKAALALQGARQYSVVAEGNVITSVPLDSYMIDTFPKIAEKYGSKWTLALKEDKDLFYFYEVWFAKRLTYKFYDAKGVNATITLPIEIPVDLSPNWKMTNEGSLIFEGPGSICLGYKARPIRETETGEIVPMATGSITAEGKSAGKKLDDRK